MSNNNLYNNASINRVNIAKLKKNTLFKIFNFISRDNICKLKSIRNRRIQSYAKYRLHTEYSKFINEFMHDYYEEESERNSSILNTNIQN